MSFYHGGYYGAISIMKHHLTYLVGNYLYYLKDINKDITTASFGKLKHRIMKISCGISLSSYFDPDNIMYPRIRTGIRGISN